MNIIEFIPRINKSWVPLIFYFSESKLINKEKIIIEDIYILSSFYGTSKLTNSVYYKPMILF